MGRSGFKGVPGLPGEKGKSILPPDEWRFKVMLKPREILYFIFLNVGIYPIRTHCINYLP